MASAFNKELRRSITHSIGRFLAIAIISALGCGFYAGLRMTPIDMNLSADAFYDGTNMSDLYLTGTLGLDDEDVAMVEQVEGVAAAEPVRMADAYATLGDAKYVMRFNSLDLEAARASDCSDGMQAKSDDAGYINRPVLVEGSWPSNPAECVVAADAVLDEPVQVGDVIEIVDTAGEVEDTFTRTQYTVTGFVRSPYYVMTSNFGSSDLGGGGVDTYVFIPDSDFAENFPYTGVFVTASEVQAELYPSDGYDSIVDALAARIEGMSMDFRVARLAAVQADAQTELDDARAEYDRERANALDELDSAAAELDSAKRELDDAAMTLSNTRSQLASAQADLDAGQARLDETKGLLDAKQAALDAGMREYEQGAAALAAARAEAEVRFSEAQARVDAIADPVQRAYAQAALDKERDLTQKQFDEKQRELSKVKADLDAGATALALGWQDYEAGVRQSEEGRAALADGRARLARGQAEYDSGVAEYERGRAEYESGRATALAELADAKAKLDDAQAEIDEIELPDFYVLDREKNMGAAGREADASRIDRIAQVFPFIFFLVAALVSLTTMTRMVDEERMLIGTYKALGYGNARIISKYLIYALVASGVGSIIGILTLSQFLPRFINRAYSIIYAIPVELAPIDVPIALMSFVLGVGITLLATWFAAFSSLRERPALLMLPRAPKPGKRILLERVTPLWRRLSFSGKVTARNLFRYKRRFLMAIIGIAGCTALLLTGLGLHDGINDIIDKQFSELQHYNLEVRVADDQDAQDAEEVRDALDASPIVTDLTYVASENAIVSNASSNEDFRAVVTVPSNIEEFESFYTLRERMGHEPLTLDGSGAIITEKMASGLGVSEGDVIELYDQSIVGERSGAAHEVRVAGVAEFYTGNHVFMTEQLYMDVTGKTVEFTDILCMAQAPLEERTELSNQMLGIEGVEVVSFYDEIIETYRTMLQTVNTVVIVLILAAALLAFVVLYNLTNINITERIREIATLKVLGFTPGETNAYIFRETILLTIIGAVLGCVLGIWMEGFVVVTAEVDEMMFGREIHPLSYVSAFALTIAFSFIVSLFMRPKIKAIDMVESLKSVD